MYAILDNFLIHTLVFTSTGITVNIPVATLSDLSIKDPKYAAISNLRLSTFYFLSTFICFLEPIHH